MFKAEDKEGSDDDLMAELNGGSAPAPEAPAAPAAADALPEAASPEDAAQLQAEADSSARNPLILEPEPTPSALAKLKAAGKEKGYDLVVEGTYLGLAKTPGAKKEKKNFLINVVLPSLDGALSVVKNKLLDKMIPMKYPDYVTYRTYEITSAKPRTEDTAPTNNVTLMDEKDLAVLVKARRIPINPKDFAGDLKGFRASVVDFLLNPKDFAKRHAEKMKERAEDLRLEKLNGITAAGGK